MRLFFATDSCRLFVANRALVPAIAAELHNYIGRAYTLPTSAMAGRASPSQSKRKSHQNYRK